MNLRQWCSIIVILTSISNAQPFDSSRIWAVLVAGSNTYGNYRHQADICHAYHVLREHGVPVDHIIVMIYDDIAYSVLNPHPGVVVNAVNGSNVYEGVVKDYIGKDVNSQNFLNILTGNEEKMKGIGSGRVLKSGPEDHVFINFADHGGQGMLCFPSGEDVLYAPDLAKAIQTMYEKRMYRKMVIYIEACESGSMFDNFLKDNLNVFAVTAAKRGEDSYACCWDDEVQTYVGDVFSVNWMDDSDIEDLRKETLSQQYDIVVNETHTSNPQEFGTLSIGTMRVGEFMGMRKYTKVLKKPKSKCQDAVASPNVPIAVLQRKLESATSFHERQQLKLQIKQIFKLRRSVDRTMEHVISLVLDGSMKHKFQYMLAAKESVTRSTFPCYKKLSKHWFKRCYGHSTSPYSIQKLSVLANLCVDGSVPVSKVIQAMNTVCATISERYGIL